MKAIKNIIWNARECSKCNKKHIYWYFKENTDICGNCVKTPFKVKSCHEEWNLFPKEL